MVLARFCLLLSRNKSRSSSGGETPGYRIETIPLAAKGGKEKEFDYGFRTSKLH